MFSCGGFGVRQWWGGMWGVDGWVGRQWVGWRQQWVGVWDATAWVVFFVFVFVYMWWWFWCSAMVVLV